MVVEVAVAVTFVGTCGHARGLRHDDADQSGRNQRLEVQVDGSDIKRFRSRSGGLAADAHRRGSSAKAAHLLRGLAAALFKNQIADSS